MKDYELGEELGRGSMGVVYRARQRSLERDVALKLVSERALLGLDSDEVLRRFEREVRALIAVSHPNIVRVYDVGREGDVPWVAMELVDGEPLSALMRESGPMVADHALHVVRQLADALAECHSKGLMHRDVKPSNVMVSSDGRVKLMDFGLAKDDGASYLTHADAFIGTPRYAAPEMFQTADSSAAVDVYALGVILLELLAGQPAYPGIKKENLIVRVLEGPQPLRPLRPDLPEALVAFVERMVAQAPARRPSAAEVVAAIDSGALGVKLAGPTSRVPLDELERAARARAEALLHPPTEVIPKPKSTPAARIAVPPVLTGGQSRRNGAAAAVGVAVALLALLLGSRGGAPTVRATPAPAPSLSARPVAMPSASATSPARAMPPVIVRYPPLFARWREIEPEWHALHGADAIAREAVARIKRSIPMEMGAGPEPWIHWIELGRWLGGEGPRDRPPRYRRASPGVMDKLSFGMVQGHLLDYARSFGPRLLCTAMRDAGQWPADGRAWVLLGHALELEGAHAQAREAYRWAVPNLPALSARGVPTGDGLVFEELRTLRGAAPVHWYALARALLVNPQVELARGWWAHEPAVFEEAWEALARALHDRPDLHDAVLARMPQDALGLESMELRRGHWRALHGDPEGALHTWTESFRSGRGRWVTHLTVIKHLLDRGRVAEARAFAGHPASGDEVEVMLRQLEVPDACPVPAAEVDRRLINRRMRMVEIGRLIAAGQLAEAERILRWHPQGLGSGWQNEAVAFALVGAGATGATWARTASELLVGGPYDAAGWLEAAGDLGTPAGGPHFELAAQRTAKLWPESPIPHLARAVWASRQDRHAAALDALAKAREVDRTGLLPAHAVLEVLARPVVMRGIGRILEESVVGRALADPGPDDPVAGPIWSALRDWRLDDARERARRAREVAPHEHAWTLVMVACAHIQGPKDKFLKWQAEALDSARSSPGPVWRMRMLRTIGLRQ